MRQKLKNLRFVCVLFLSIAFSLVGNAQNMSIGEYDLSKDSAGYNLLTGGHVVPLDSTGITIKFIDGITQNDKLSFYEFYNLTFIRESVGEYANCDLSYFSDFISVCDSIIGDSMVGEFIFHYKIQLHSYIPDDPDLLDQWYLDQIDVYEAWDLTVGKDDIIVAVIDEGLFNHDDIADDSEILENIFHNPGEDEWNSWDNPDSGNGIDDDENNKVDDWKGWNYCNHVLDPPDIEQNNNVIPEQDFAYHGTSVSGVIAAKTNNNDYMAGISGGNFDENTGGTKVLPIKFSDYKWDPIFQEWDFVANTDEIAEMIYYAVNMGANIINMSWGISVTPGLMGDIEAAFEYAHVSNVLLIASVGNDYYTNFIPYPANSDYVVAVGATDQSDEDADFSNNGDEIDLAAPGVNILTLNNYSTDYYNGTSFSAPMVAATAALMLSVNPDLTNIELEDIIKNTAEKVGSHPYQNGWNKYLGYGRINTHHAVCEALNYLDPIEVQDPDGLWDEPVLSKDDIIVKDGSKLTITSTVYISPGKHLIVEQGAKLIIDGGTITNFPYCDEANTQWGGIQVWGDATEHQFPDENGNYSQGYLELNNAIIENAVIAVDLWNPVDPINHTYTGGIIKAQNAIFRNNAKSIHALHYDNYLPGNEEIKMDYSAFFKNCTFEITDEYLGSHTFYKHIDLNNVEGVRFRGCDFSLAQGANNISLWNDGIAAYDAGFNALAYCNSFAIPCPEEDYKKCTFTGFYRGIYVSNPHTSNTFHISRAIFTNNKYGIKASSADFAIVLFSEFNLGEGNYFDSTECMNLNGCGIYLDNSTGFSIEENNFTKYSIAPPGNYIGIGINTTNGVDEIYRNSFSGVSYANYSEGKNYGDDSREGLVYYCNLNNNNYADLFVASGFQSGIQDNQGSDDEVTGNTFSQSGSTWHFYNGGDYLVGYYYCDYCPNENPDDDKIEYVTDKGKSFDNPCPSHYGDPTHNIVLDGQEKLQKEQDYNTALIDFNGVNALFESLRDGGNTNAELSDIQNAQPDDMWTLRAQLLGDSPHLSQEVLMETSDRTDVFPDDVLLDILSANPDELRKDTLLSYLENKQDPLPAYMIDILELVAEGTSYNTVLRNQLSRYKRNMTRAAHDLIRSVLHDTLSNFLELRNWLDNLGGINADYQIITSYIHEDNYTDALILANMIPQLYELSGNDSIEHEYFLDYLNLQNTLFQQNRKLSQLDSTELSQLVLIADSSQGIASAKAKSVLENYYGYHFACCPNIDETAGFKNDPISNQTLSESFGLQIDVVPNPANQWAAFNYSIPSKQKTGLITITDITGKLIVTLPVKDIKGQIIWDTRFIQTGLYFYTLTVSGMKKSGKLIIR